MFSSCSPIGALYAGVKIGSGRQSPSCNPAGSAMPQTVPDAWYSLNPDPVRYPRTTHSTGSISSERTTIARPATAAGMRSTTSSAVFPSPSAPSVST